MYIMHVSLINFKQKKKINVLQVLCIIISIPGMHGSEMKGRKTILKNNYYILYIFYFYILISMNTPMLTCPK